MPEKDLTSDDVARMDSTQDLMAREWAPCRYHCPVHADVRSYIELIARGQWRAAIDVIRERLPLASVCGRICHHPCEANCRRDGVDEALAIREVKRFVSERQGAAGATVHKVDQDGPKVAIVGAGPAGLAAALELAKAGFRPTVLEKDPVAGGIPATAIPKYRLPRDVIRQDVDWICAHGVEIVTGVDIGGDKSIADLKADGFEAVIIATGRARSRMLPIPGGDNERCLPVLRFLRRTGFDEPVDIGGNVLVIGGGNVAMDAARTAVRMGAKRVRAMCLENEEEMPAFSWEREEALEEGVNFIHRRGPVEILLTGGAIHGVRTRKVTRVFDDTGAFSPQYDDADVQDVECDTVIMAIGQMPDTGFLSGSGLECDERGRMKYDPTTHRTSQEDVFACGEIVTAPGSVVEACASGQRAAKAVYLHLSGREIVIEDDIPEAIGVLPDETAQTVPQVDRNPVHLRPPEQRRKDFEAVDFNFSADAAMREARRCMNCGGGAEVLVDKCAACLTCLRVCPFDIPVVTDVARIDSALCQSCGMCIVECPANAIVARSWDVRGQNDDTAAEIRKLPKRKIVAYVCGHHSSSAAWSGELEDTIGGVVEIYMPSMGRLGSQHILHALENGASGVIVVACRIGADRYPTVTQRVRKRVSQVRDMLAEIGVSPDKVQLVEEASEGRKAMRDAMVEAAEKIDAT